MLKQEFNTSHTVYDLHMWLRQKGEPSDSSELEWKLMFDYPPKPLDPNDKSSLEEMRMLNAEVRQIPA